MISLLASLYIILYNKLQFAKIRIEEAEKVILEELQNRFELIMKSKPTIEKNTKMDLSFFSDLEKSKTSNISSYEFDKKITTAISTMYLILADYPKLEEKKDIKEVMRKLDESDTRINAAKDFYNKNNTKLIALIKAFPSNIVALIHKINIQPYYDAKEIFNEIDDGIKI
jgi:LemA protein